jgi:hypothetical protein
MQLQISAQGDVVPWLALEWWAAQGPIKVAVWIRKVLWHCIFPEDMFEEILVLLHIVCTPRHSQDPAYSCRTRQ